jgi:DmsE family decaheme c-type cytochrome
VDKRGEFNLPYSHPVLSGKVTCGDCHDPHKGPALKGGTLMASEQEVCGKCHMPQQGPFVFQHEAVREGCTTCHAVHGSVNAKMLTQRNANLCLKCHMQTLSGTVTLGSVNHTAGPTFNLNKGTCWTAGCHEAVHGSQVSVKLRF